MKKLLSVVVVLSLAFVACDAFKENYDGGSLANGGTTGGSLLGNVAAGDFSADTTVCTAVAGVTVTKSSADPAITATAIDGELESGSKVEATADQVGAFTTKITVNFGDKSVAFVIKQTAENAFSACSLVYNDLKVKSGTITIERFNENAETDLTKALNSGSFSFEFEAAGVSIPLSNLVGAEAAGEKIEGTYYVEGLTAAKTAE